MSLDVRPGVATDAFARIWDTRPGLTGWLGAVNHKQVGKRFVVTAMAFFLLGGIQALIMRLQLGTPDNTLLDPQRYNELFTMHGTTMLFLFAVPVTEGLAIYFVPLMLGARDMPFPRLNAFGYWGYLFGGLFLYASFAVGSAPDGGWFAYVPLTGPDYSPGSNLDFWLLGVTFVEISGVVAAIEIIVLVFKFRAPGMTLSRMPLFVWAALVTATMIIFAFPPLIAGGIMLEFDRKLGTHFFNAAAGGSPLLWQHLFWWFGHPEVYIMSLPAFGIISTIVPVFARTRILGYTFIATATVAIGFFSFGVWVHHMFTTGIAFLGLSFFTAGSLVIAVPSAVQFFAWTGTLWKGRLQWRTPLLWTLGFLFIFALGGVTGVMLAVVPFTWQVHDTYFVVAHFHYVLIGGVVFPAFAAIYYWTPKISGKMLSERLGTVSFALSFIGFNLTFFPQHFLGLAGMVRRIYTWPAGLGWEGLNLASTIGAFLLGAGILVFLIDFYRTMRHGAPAGDDPWGAGTLEWAAASPPAGYNFRHTPRVASRDPLWDEALPSTVGITAPREHPGGGAPTKFDFDPARPRRQMLATSVLDAEPEHVVTLPVHSLWPLWLALAMGVMLLGALIDAVVVFVVGVAAVCLSIAAWLWDREDEVAGD